ncbi:MAG: DNA-deoxyinosine glycosylase [Methylococcales bacterium]|nr:DNA-deoxyinosine glycosylase [Methylococcales bacterium]
MKKINGFPPIADKNAKILILGSMPSEASLLEQEYYAHKRNAFWPMMRTIFNDGSADYNQRKKLLIGHDIAVWDVLKQCYRQGSLDSAINMDSIESNDFQSFFRAHKQVKKVIFNGAKAESIYLKFILPQIESQFAYLQYKRLPSTSPAHAAMTVDQKIAIWKKELKDDCVL